MGIRILVIEDEPAIADFLLRGLREESFTVEHAGDGDAAWYALRGGGWDLVVLDWWLPAVDGLTLLRRYRQCGQTTPVLFLTARDAVSDRVRGLDGGADDYLCKPFAFDELLARVRALTRRTERRSSVRRDAATERVKRFIVSRQPMNRSPRPPRLAANPLSFRARPSMRAIYRRPRTARTNASKLATGVARSTP